MGRLRNKPVVAVLAVVGAIVVIGGAAVAARTVMEDQARAKVRDVAVGTWRCDERYKGELQSVSFVGIASDGRIGSAEQVPEDDQPVGTGKEPTTLVEFGAWTVDGLTVELRFPLMFGSEDLVLPDEDGEPVTYEYMIEYTGDADPPKEVLITDHLNGDKTAARWSADIAEDEATFVEVERASGEPGVMDYECTRRSSDEPKLAKPR